MNWTRRVLTIVVFIALGSSSAVVRASAGDPQVKTDHPWYPGELSCSTFDRLFRTQAELYRRVTGRAVDTDEDKALASWYWRNLHFAHGEEGQGDCFDQGFTKGDWNRDYWTGLFAHGFGLCGTVHSQYAAEINALLGHCRARCVGVTGHNSFEVWLTGGAYGAGRWALLDHDVSTVVFDDAGSRLLSVAEILPDLAKYKDPAYNPARQRGWRVAGLHDGDAAAFDSFRTVEYLAGYAGVPPMVHLRPGESLRRYLAPGLEDGKTFVFWGRNYNTAGVPGPERSRTWVNQPERMFGSKDGAGHRDGQVRYANAVYTYTPDFAGGSYKQGVISESSDHVTFEFYTPYVIGSTPPNDKPWGAYDAGGKNGLVVSGNAPCTIQISTDQGTTWQPGGELASGPLDLTNLVKGHRQYWLRFGAGAGALKDSGLTWRTVCQANVATIPRLRDGTNRITYLSTGRAVASAGPNKDQAAARVVDGRIDSPAVTLELSAPRGERAVKVYAAGWQASGNPPSPDVAYFIDYSADAGKTWRPVVSDWRIIRRPPEPKDFWSQSFCWGDADLPPDTTGPVRVRFRNTGGKAYRKVEAHLVYEVAAPSPTQVTFAWRQGEGGALQTATHTYPSAPGREDTSWRFDAGRDVRTAWVEYAVKP